MKIKISSLVKLFFIISFLLNSGYCYVLNNDSFTLISLFICGCVVIGYYGLVKKSVLTKRFWLHPFTWLILWIFISMFLHLELNIFGTYFRQIFVLLIAILLSQNISFSKFIKTFIDFMFFITLISIIAWILVNVITVDLHLPIMYSGWEKAYFAEYQNGLLFFIHSHQPYKLMGPFWEPGLYSSMAVIAYLFLDSKYYGRRIKRVMEVTLCIGIILSFSTAGYVLLAIASIVKLLYAFEKKLSFLTFLLIAITIFVIYVFSEEVIRFLALMIPSVFEKMINGSFSASTRFNGPLVDLIIFYKNIYFGAGYEEYLREWPYYANLLYVESRTSTITYFIAVFGLPGTLYVWTIIKGIFSQYRLNGYIKIFILFILISIVSKEPHYVNLFTVTLFAYLAQYKTIFIKNNLS